LFQALFSRVELRTIFRSVIFLLFPYFCALALTGYFGYNATDEETNETNDKRYEAGIKSA
jgi:hypothetical protein